MPYARPRGRILLASALVAVASQLAGVPSPLHGAAAATTPRRLNILFVVTDDQTIQSLRYATMPYFRSQLADRSQRWTTFSNAFDNDPLCCPARATILSGQYAHHTGVWCVDNRRNKCGAAFDDRHSVATWLHHAGYTTGLFGKYFNFYPFGRGLFTAPGWDRWDSIYKATGEQYYNYRMVENGKLVSYGSAPQDHSTVVIGNEATNFLSRAQQPFFAYVATDSPHEPRTAEVQNKGAFKNQRIIRTPAFNEANVSDKPAWVRRLPRLDPAVPDTLQRKELASLLDVDDMLRQLFGALRARGVWKNTAVIYVSDNGYSYGDHRWDNKRCPYEECMRVPLFIRDPRHGVTHTSRALVSNVDLASTVAEFAHVTPDIHQDGRSLRPLLTGTARAWPQNKGLLFEYRSDGVTPSWVGVRTRRFLFDELATGEKELYALRRDPYEMRNVAGRVGYRAAVPALECKVRRLLGKRC
jgi:arylsulfatase A-like enzyme